MRFSILIYSLGPVLDLLGLGTRDYEPTGVLKASPITLKLTMKLIYTQFWMVGAH